MEYFRELNLPQVLYRVQYPGCQTRYSPEDGLSARDRTTVPNDTEQLGHFVKESFTWGSLIYNPFINLFSERSHAVNWAISESGRTRQSYLVISIDTSELDRSHIVKLSTVTRRLDIAIPEQALGHVHGAYLYLHLIPAEVISTTETTEELLRERYIRESVRENFVPHCRQQPGTHWNDELHGYYSTDSEIEESNINDDLL